MPAKKKAKAKPVGRPPFKITAAIIKKVRKFAAQGLTKEQIALNLGITYKTLNEKTKDFSDFSDAIELGRAEGIQVVTNALIKNCKKGDAPSIKYYLNNRSNKEWKDRITTTHDGTVTLTDLSADELDRKIRTLNHKLEQATED